VRREAEALGLPAFVKPARAGSSVGVSKVTSWDDLGAAVETALAEDDRALIESAVVGREVEIAVLGGRPGEPARGSVAGEFYDFAAKYLDAPGIDLVCPADLTDAEMAEMRDLGVRAFDAIGAEGLSRVDFFLTADGFVVNEINTMPGFTPISMFPRCWQESGLAYPALITELLEVALARAA
jgi:D-alanine-D-alanine ligase